MKTPILDLQLETIREFQEKYPKSHVGGSFGLFLLGYDLKRDMSESYEMCRICERFTALNTQTVERELKQQQQQQTTPCIFYTRVLGGRYIFLSYE